MTLTQHLAVGYRYEIRHEGPDPAPQAAEELDPAEISDYIARMNAGVNSIVKRDHIARTHVAFLQRVLDLQNAHP